MSETRTVEITLNGQRRQIAATQTVAALLKALSIDGSVGGVAVAVNASVVPRSRWGETPLNEGDDVEVVRATAGG